MRPPTVPSEPVSGWRFAAASVTGQAHIEAESECEDAWYCGQTGNGFAIGVVSDGAGSAAQGGYAARQICAAFASLAPELARIEVPLSPAPVAEPPAAPASEPEEGLPETAQPDWSAVLHLVRECLVKVRTELAGHAAEHDHSIDDYLATLVGVIAHPDCGVLVFHIGDGAVTIFGEDGEPLLTSQPENGQYLNQTYFLVEEEWEQHCRTTDLIGLGRASIFLMTDGVTDLAYHREGRSLRPEARFFLPLVEYLEARPREAGEKGLHGLLDTERAREMVNDDKTIVWMKFTGHVEPAA